MADQDKNNHSTSCLLTPYLSASELIQEGTSFPSPHPLILPFPPTYTASMYTILFAEVFSSSIWVTYWWVIPVQVKYPRKNCGGLHCIHLQSKAPNCKPRLNHLRKIWTCRLHQQPYTPSTAQAQKADFLAIFWGFFFSLQDLLSEKGSWELLSFHQWVGFTLLH